MVELSGYYRRDAYPDVAQTQTGPLGEFKASSVVTFPTGLIRRPQIFLYSAQECIDSVVLSESMFPCLTEGTGKRDVAWRLVVD
jgi:hypothetical protein